MRMTQKGFTLIELMIVIAFLGILLAILVPVFGGVTSPSGENTVSIGWNGMTETRCIDGYKFVIGEGGHARQVMDEYGHGVRCEQRR